MSSTAQSNIHFDEIPTPPHVAANLLDAIDDPKTTTDDLLTIISADVGLTAKLISFCNSPSQQRKHPVQTLKQAVVRVGAKRLKMLALSFSLMRTDRKNDFDQQTFWTKSLATAITFSEFAKFDGTPAEEAFLFGLVANVGEMAMSLSSEEYRCEHQRPTLISTDELERETNLFGIDRFEVGKILLERWNFPSNICEELGKLSGDLSGDQSAIQKYLLVSKVAATLYGKTDDEYNKLAFTSATAHYNASNDEIADAIQRLAVQWDDYAELLGLNAKLDVDVSVLEQKAKAKLLEISLHTEEELEETRERHCQLERESMQDDLTKIKNRRAYVIETGECLTRAKDERKPFAIMVLDVDFFKLVNDTYGHAAGDEVLKAIGVCLQNNCRSHDEVYRIGGEEFTIVLYDCTREQAALVAERFRKAVESLKITVGDEQDISVTASLGVSWAATVTEVKVDSYFERADEMLYEAKNSGRNRFVISPVA